MQAIDRTAQGAPRTPAGGFLCIAGDPPELHRRGRRHRRTSAKGPKEPSPAALAGGPKAQGTELLPRPVSGCAKVT